TSTRQPSPTRHTFVHANISEGGGDFVSTPQSNEAPQTPAATAAGGAEDSVALTALSLKLDRCLHRVTTLETELGITKKVLGGVVLKLVTRVKWLEGLLQQRKRRLVLSNSEGDDTTLMEQDIDLAALHTLARTSLGGDSSNTPAGHDVAEVHADTSMPSRTTRRRIRKPFSSFASENFLKTFLLVRAFLLLLPPFLLPARVAYAEEAYPAAYSYSPLFFNTYSCSEKRSVGRSHQPWAPCLYQQQSEWKRKEQQQYEQQHPQNSSIHRATSKNGGSSSRNARTSRNVFRKFSEAKDENGFLMRLRVVREGIEVSA
nr:hypothetical protein [Tanacetum cinerariifolium]